MASNHDARSLLQQRTGRGCLAGSAGTSNLAQLTGRRQSQEWRITQPSGEEWIVSLTGRPAWLLSLLADAGARGLSARDLPAGLRVSGYVHRLRCQGVPIVTGHQSHGGTFPGHHAVYRLDCMAEPLGKT